jgi:hypothetical protein
MRNSDWHSGISMHKIRVGGGVAGFIVAIGIVLIGLVSVPLFRYFMVLAAGGGGVSVGLVFVSSLETELTGAPAYAETSSFSRTIFIE